MLKMVKFVQTYEEKIKIGFLLNTLNSYFLYESKAEQFLLNSSA